MVTYSAEIQVSKQDTSDESDDPISLSISLIHSSLIWNLLISQENVKYKAGVFHYSKNTIKIIFKKIPNTRVN